MAVSTCDHGDFHLERVDPTTLDVRRRALVDLPWTMLDEVHGTEVVIVDGPGAGDGHRGDVAVTDVADAALGVWVGDCAPVVLVAGSGRFAVVHAGWRGLAAGVLDRALEAMGAAQRSDIPIAAYLGPCIGPCCYEFATDDLELVARRLLLPVPTISSRTRWGTTALDVPAAVTAVLARHHVTVVRHGGCTGCGGHHFSHRMRRDAERHAVVAWREAS